jgi:tetratricopeptide (TPR) repeat protein
MTKAELWRAITMALAVSVASGPAYSGNSGDYLAARQARLSSDYDAAVYYYVRALGADPRNPQLLEGAALAQLSAGDLPRAVAVSERMEDQGIQSQVSQAVLSADAFLRGDNQAILDRVAADRGVGPLVDGLMEAWAQLGAGDMTKALAAFDKVAEAKGMHGFAYYHKALALTWSAISKRPKPFMTMMTSRSR